MLAGLITGPATSENWVNESRNVDFYDAKGDLESLCWHAG